MAETYTNLYYSTTSSACTSCMDGHVSRDRPTGFFIAAIILQWSEALVTPNTSLISGPEPMTVVAPVGAIVTFTCVVNTTVLPAGTMLFGNTIGWIVNGTVLEVGNQLMVNGTLRIGTRRLPVIQDYVTGVPVQCEVVVRELNTPIFLRSNNNATLTAYGRSNSL